MHDYDFSWRAPQVLSPTIVAGIWDSDLYPAGCTPCTLCDQGPYRTCGVIIRRFSANSTYRESAG